MISFGDPKINYCVIHNADGSETKTTGLVMNGVPIALEVPQPGNNPSFALSSYSTLYLIFYTPTRELFLCRAVESQGIAEYVRNYNTARPAYCLTTFFVSSIEEFLDNYFYFLIDSSSTIPENSEINICGCGNYDNRIYICNKITTHDVANYYVDAHITIRNTVQYGEKTSFKENSFNNNDTRYLFRYTDYQGDLQTRSEGDYTITDIFKGDSLSVNFTGTVETVELNFNDFYRLRYRRLDAGPTYGIWEYYLINLTTGEEIFIGNWNMNNYSNGGVEINRLMITIANFEIRD